MNESLKDILINQRTLKDISAADLWNLYNEKNITAGIFSIVEKEVIRRISTSLLIGQPGDNNCR